MAPMLKPSKEPVILAAVCKSFGTRGTVSKPVETWGIIVKSKSMHYMYVPMKLRFNICIRGEAIWRIPGIYEWQ